MNRFWILLKKELRDMITVQAILPMVIVLVVFSLLGQFIGSATQQAAEDGSTVTAADFDDTQTSRGILARLEQSGYTVNLLPAKTEQEITRALQDTGGVLVIEKGFEQALIAGKVPEVSAHTRLSSFAMLSSIAGSSVDRAAERIGELLKQDVLANAGVEDPQRFEMPVTVKEYTHVNGRSAQVSSDAVQSIAMSQTIFVPMIIFMIVVMASQMTATAIANEKGDKTLETLLSTPISRLSVLFAKMVAAGLGSLLMSVVFLLGFSSYMGSLTGGMVSMAPAAAEGAGNNISAVAAAMNTLGLTLSPLGFLVVGVELFVTILIALAISTMLGAMAEDIKGVQTAVTPIMFCVLIPYMISLFADITALPLALRIPLYLIPFTHTFVATAAMVFGNYTLVVFGALYQLLFLALSLYLAVRLFSSDKLFTAKITRRKARKAAAQ